MPDRSPHVAYFSPLQPVPSGISQYSEDLVPWLARAVRLDLFVDGYTPLLADTLRPARIRQARRYRPTRYDATLIHMGNSPAHNYMVPVATAQPHILVLHDIVLHHLMVWRAVQARGGRETYRREMRARYGVAGEHVAALVLRGQNPNAMFEYPLNEDLIRAARLVVTHSPSSAAWVERLVPGTQTRIVPMGVPPFPRHDAAAARERLGIGRDTFVVLSLGHVNPFKRMPAVFRALRRLADDVPDVLLLMAGGDSPNYDVPRLARFAGVERYVRRLGYVADDALPDIFAASDVCVNLRYPTAGETSAAVLRLLSAGLPVIVTDTGAFSDFPDDAVLKVAPDAFEGETLIAFLRALATDAPLRRAAGENGRAYALREHGMRRVTEQWLAVIGEVTGRTLAPERIITPPVVQSTPVPPVAQSISRTAPVAPNVGVAALPDACIAPIADALAMLGLAEDDAMLTRVARTMHDLGMREPGRGRQS